MFYPIGIIKSSKRLKLSFQKMNSPTYRKQCVIVIPVPDPYSEASNSLN